MHPVENAERLTQVHQNEPRREAEKLFPKAVLKLGVDSKRRDDPQLQEEGTGMYFMNAEITKKLVFLLKSDSKHTSYYHDIAKDEERTDFLYCSFGPGLFPMMLWRSSWRVPLQH